MQTAAPVKKDQRRKTAARLFIVGVMALLLLPGPLWILLRAHVDTQNYENRTLAEFPKGVSVEQWPAAFEAWLGDHAPFRNQWMSLNAQLNWALNSLDSSDVLRGKENWLFLKDVSDSKSLSDYQGLTAYTPEEQAQFAQILGQLQAALHEKGSRLAVVFAPAKEGVASRYMPDSIPVVAQPTRVDALAKYLQQEGFLVIWPRDALLEVDPAQQTYYKYDTHWNQAGAFLAADQLLSALDLPHTAWNPELIQPDPEQTAPTDLANVCAAWTLCTDDVYYTVDAPKAVLLEASPAEQILHYTGTGQGTMLMIRDSFGEAMAPFAAAAFQNTLVLHGNALGQGALNQELTEVPDVVVLEVGERMSDGLLAYAQRVLEWVQTCS